MDSSTVFCSSPPHSTPRPPFYRWNVTSSIQLRSTAHARYLKSWATRFQYSKDNIARCLWLRLIGNSPRAMSSIISPASRRVLYTMWCFFHNLAQFRDQYKDITVRCYPAGDENGIQDNLMPDFGSVVSVLKKSLLCHGSIR